MINDKLPPNLLIKIFSHLDASGLGAAVQVCQLWSFIIRTTPKIMKTVYVKITSDRTTEHITIYDQIPFGLHQNIEIVDYCGDFIILQLILSLHRNDINFIKIIRPAVWNAKLFTDTFCVLKNLNELILDNCQLCDFEETRESGENFINLRHLTVKNCCCEIFEFFRDCHLTSLTIEYSPTFNSQNSTSMKNLTNLLKNSSTITNLTISGATKFEENFLCEKTNFKFQLEQLKLDEIEGTFVSEDCVVDFLNSQKESLKKLTILKTPKSEKLQNLINEIRSNCGKV